MTNKDAPGGLRRTKRTAAQNTNAFFANGGEWDDLRALTKALEASRMLNDNRTECSTGIESDTASVISVMDQREKRKRAAKHLLPTSSGMNRTNHTTPKSSANDNNKGQQQKSSNKINKLPRPEIRPENGSAASSSSKPRALRDMKPLFSDYIPVADDLFKFIHDVPFKDLPKYQQQGIYFLDRGATMKECRRRFSLDNPRGRLIPKTNEALPVCFKENYKKCIESLRQKADFDDVTCSSKSSIKDSGFFGASSQTSSLDINGNAQETYSDYDKHSQSHVEEIFHSQSEESDEDDSSKLRYTRNQRHLNGYNKIVTNGTRRQIASKTFKRPKLPPKATAKRPQPTRENNKTSKKAKTSSKSSSEPEEFESSDEDVVFIESIKLGETPKTSKSTTDKVTVKPSEPKVSDREEKKHKKRSEIHEKVEAYFKNEHFKKQINSMSKKPILNGWSNRKTASPARKDTSEQSKQTTKLSSDSESSLSSEDEINTPIVAKKRKKLQNRSSKTMNFRSVSTRSGSKRPVRSTKRRHDGKF